MYVRYRSMTLSDTCTIRRSWTLHAVPGLPVVAWGERGNILLARSFHAAHCDRDSCEKSAWKYRGNIVRWTWILQRFNEERNPFLVCGKTWLIITFRCVYCKMIVSGAVEWYGLQWIERISVLQFFEHFKQIANSSDIWANHCDSCKEIENTRERFETFWKLPRECR